MTAEQRCFCGNPTDRSLWLAWMRFDPKPDDEPDFMAPYCNDCQEVVWAKLQVDRAQWEAQKAEAKVKERVAVVEQKVAEWLERQKAKRQEVK